MNDEFIILRLLVLLTSGSLVLGMILRAGQEATAQRARVEARQRAAIQNASRTRCAQSVQFPNTPAASTGVLARPLTRPANKQ
jgi:hypothetical protein